MGARRSGIVADNDYVAGGHGAIELAPAEEGGVDSIVGGSGWADEGLVEGGAAGLRVYKGTRRNSVRFRLVECDGCRASECAGVQVPPGMVLANGYGMGYVASHALNRSDGV